MSFVGPRPEVPRYVDRYTPEQQSTPQLQARHHRPRHAGFPRRETLLRGATDVEDFYVKHCIPGSSA